MPYLPATDINGPAEVGVLVGTYFDGSPNYLGRGDNTLNLNQKPCPARISVNSLKPGAFMQNLNTEVYDNQNAEYLHDHPNMMWFKETGNTAMSNSKAIKFISSTSQMMMARKNFTSFTLVAKVR